MEKKFIWVRAPILHHKKFDFDRIQHYGMEGSFSTILDPSDQKG